MSKKISPQKNKVVVSKQQQIKESQQKLQQQKEQARQRVKVLQTSGILDAYEYLLRQVCKNGLPDTNIFQFAAQQILKYQKKMKQNNQKKEELLSLSKVQQKERKSIDKKSVLLRQDRSKDKGLNK